MEGNNNLVTGNYVGTNAAGNAAVVNGAIGVDIDGNNNAMGGPVARGRNVMSGNAWRRPCQPGTGNPIEGNYARHRRDRHRRARRRRRHGRVRPEHREGQPQLTNFAGISVRETRTRCRATPSAPASAGVGASPNSTGIRVFGGDGNQIGGPGDGEGNLVSGNTFSGVRSRPAPATRPRRTTSRAT